LVIWLIPFRYGHFQDLPVHVKPGLRVRPSSSQTGIRTVAAAGCLPLKMVAVPNCAHRNMTTRSS
jgi:hypothetical protein